MSAAAALEKVRIIVVGDSGVGKTSLVHLLAHGQSVGNPGWTIGCTVEVKLHEYKAGTPAEKTYFVELWDIGGSSQHENSRSIFYNPVNGIVLVHDLTNRKSHQNLRKWLAEVLNKGSNKESSSINDYDYEYFRSSYDYDPEQFVGNQIPILLVGTKADQSESLRANTQNTPSRSCSLAEECGADQINIDCNQVKYLTPGSTNAVKLAKFFDKVIERRYHSKEGNQGHSPFSTPTTARRWYTQHAAKGAHMD